MDKIIGQKQLFAKTPSPQKILQALKKVQFVMEFFILSKFSQNSDVIPQFLMGIQAIKFYYKIAHFSHQQNIYLQHDEQAKQVGQVLSAKPLQKMSQLLQKIKSKPYMSNNYQPQQFQQLACGKRIQLITSVKLPDLKRCRLNFMALLGEVLSLLRPLISIVGIRLFGLNSYKSYLLSLIVDLLVLLVFQKNIKISKKIELQELSGRKKEFIMRYLFRRPLFEVIKRLVIEPLLQKIITKDGSIYKIVLSLFEMQSSITLTI